MQAGETDFAAILRALTTGRIDFIAIGAKPSESNFSGLILIS